MHREQWYMHLACHSLVCTQSALPHGRSGRIHRSTTILARRGPAMSQERHWNNTDASCCSLLWRKKMTLAFKNLALLLNVKRFWSHVPILCSLSFPRADEARARVTTVLSHCGHSRPRRVSCRNHHWSRNLFIYNWNSWWLCMQLNQFLVCNYKLHMHFLFFDIYISFLWWAKPTTIVYDFPGLLDLH